MKQVTAVNQQGAKTCLSGNSGSNKNHTAATLEILLKLSPLHLVINKDARVAHFRLEKLLSYIGSGETEILAYVHRPYISGALSVKRINLCPYR